MGRSAERWQEVMKVPDDDLYIRWCEGQSELDEAIRTVALAARENPAILVRLEQELRRK